MKETSLTAFFKGTYRGHQITKRMVLKFWWRNGRWRIHNQLYHFSLWRRGYLNKKNILCNLYVLLVPPSRQRYLCGRDLWTLGNEKNYQEASLLYVDHRYSLFECGRFGHLPYGLAWKRNRRKAANISNKVDRFTSLKYKCRECEAPTLFKNALCNACYYVSRGY